MVDLLLAVKPCVPRGALAEVASLWVVDAAAVVGAGPIGARHCAQLTVVAVETVRASAGVSVFQILWGGGGTAQSCDSVGSSQGDISTEAEVRGDRRALTVQLPPLRQGFPAHSLTWVSQLAPVKPGLQEQV